MHHGQDLKHPFQGATLVSKKSGKEAARNNVAGVKSLFSSTKGTECSPAATVYTSSVALILWQKMPSAKIPSIKKVLRIFDQLIEVSEATQKIAVQWNGYMNVTIKMQQY